MVIVRLKGGMGNQMFQYALGRQLANQLDTDLRFDLTNLLYRNNGPDFVYRNYDLDVFRVSPDFLVSPKILAPLFNLRIARLGQGLRWLATRNYEVVKEKHFHFQPEILREAREGVIYDGWFQAPRYFSGVEKEIREAFRFSRQIIPESKELLKRIEDTNAICLNVRRTDFLQVDTLNATNLDYFLRAAARMAELVDQPAFFVFSDDIVWCRENIQLPFPTEFVGYEHKGWKFGNYLQLMQSCRHYIIPNSSFAWWAAWLNEGPDKIVIAPANWFTDPAIDTGDLVPEEWLRL